MKENKKNFFTNFTKSFVGFFAKDKKRLIITGCVALVVIIAMVVGIYFLFIKEDKTPTLQESIDTRVAAYETDLSDSLQSMTDQAAVTKYLVNWAENKGIHVEKDDYNNVIYSVPATEDVEGVDGLPPYVILCGYDYSTMPSYVNSIVCALTVAKTDTPHGAFKIIFVSEENGSKTGAEGLSADYFTDDAEVFYLGNVVGSRIAESTGGFSHYVLSKGYSETSPAYNKAYTITISGIPSQKVTSKSVTMPNAIKMLGNLLANFKSNSIVFELVSFTGGTSADSTPDSATMTIVVNDDATAKLQGRLDSAIEKFYDKYQNKYPEAQYTYQVTDVPSAVISNEDTESIVSLLYTALNGVHYKDDNGDVASMTNIGYISIADRAIRIEASAATHSTDLMMEIGEAYRTISALTGVSFTESISYPVFEVNDKGKLLAENFTSSYDAYKKTSLDVKNIPEYTLCSVISQKNGNTALIPLGVTTKTRDNFAGGLAVHMQPEE